eukprot:11751785-Ditylum_brightwellii.AAC.1
MAVKTQCAYPNIVPVVPISTTGIKIITPHPCCKMELQESIALSLLDKAQTQNPNLRTLQEFH